MYNFIINLKLLQFVCLFEHTGWTAVNTMSGVFHIKDDKHVRRIHTVIGGIHLLFARKVSD